MQTDAGDSGEARLREAGRRLFAREWLFLKGVVELDGLPADETPEIAFAGRSNVGKSSLVNALTGRKALARVSNTPGRTQELNFFTLGEGLRIVDMPGYGFARAPKAKVDAWTDLILAYLKGRPNLLRVLLLIDARHGPKASDREVMQLLDKTAVSYQVILTKADKLKAAELERRLAATETELRSHPAAYPGLVATSAVDGRGLEAVRTHVARLLEERGLQNPG